jgi:alpha-methylacyl-CoA racemase
MSPGGVAGEEKDRSVRTAAPIDSVLPLRGVRVVEFGGIGPGPFAAMLLADLGADVVRIDRPGTKALFPGDPRRHLLQRGKRSVALDLSHPAATAAVLAMAECAEIIIEGFRPGVAERLGVGPAECLARQPGLVYGRMTGWGQSGPLAKTAGHDINYLSVTGGLHAIGEPGRPPQIPLNLIGDFGGGATYLLIGVLSALVSARQTGRGAVVDAAIVDGVSHLLAATYGLLNVGHWVDERGANLLDGGAPFYAVYRTADDKYMAVGALERRFYELLLGMLEIDVPAEEQYIRARWPDVRARMAQAFLERTQAEWSEMFLGTDACVTPVLGLREAADNEHLRARRTLADVNGAIVPGLAPRFGSALGEPSLLSPLPGEHTREVLEQWSIADATELISLGAAVQLEPEVMPPDG